MAVRRLLRDPDASDPSVQKRAQKAPISRRERSLKVAFQRSRPAQAGGPAQDRRHFKTATVPNSKAPAWHETFYFDLAVPDLAVVTLEFWDDDTVSGDDYLGHVALPVAEVATGRALSVPQFVERFERPALPVVIANIPQHEGWAAVSRALWDAPQLRAQYRRRRQMAPSCCPVAHKKMSTLAAYVQRTYHSDHPRRARSTVDRPNDRTNTARSEGIRYIA